MLRNGLQVDVGRQPDGGALVAAGILQAAPAPFDVGRRDPVFVLQDAPDPDIGGDLIFRQPDRLAAQVLRALDAAVAADVDSAVPEQPRHEGRDRDVVRVAACRGHDVARQRDLADVELAELEGAVERLLRLQRDRRDVAALDRRAAVEQRARAVVVADRQAQSQCHVVSLARPGRDRKASDARRQHR